MAAFPTADDEPNMGSRRAPECHRRAGFGFHLTASAVSSTTRRLVTLRLGERFAYRFGADHVANLSQHLNARRERVAIIIDDPPKLPFEGGGLLVRQFKVHAQNMVTVPRRGSRYLWLSYRGTVDRSALCIND